MREVSGYYRETNKVLKVRKRLSPTGESKGLGFCQPVSVTFPDSGNSIQFLFGEPLTPTLSAWMELFGKSVFFQVIGMQAWHHFC